MSADLLQQSHVTIPIQQHQSGKLCRAFSTGKDRMKLLPHSPAKALSKAYLKQSLKREQIELFKTNLARMFERIRTDEHEEHLKNFVSDLSTPSTV
jgi:hypothetical protein